MSGGRLVVLDRAGRDVKRFPLAEGLATLGSDPACDIRIMLPTVSPHHATVVVHANQTVVRNVCSDETQVNGRCVSVAALRHGDVIGIGGRHLRWEYAQAPAPGQPRQACSAAAALYVPRRRTRGVRRGSAPAPARTRDPQVRLALEMSHRASMPGSAGGKQVAIVQPQRRDTSELIDKNPQRTPPLANKRPRTFKSDLDSSVSEAEQEKTKRKSTARLSPKNSASNLQTTTKATLWIESRKTSPRKSNKTGTAAQEQAVRARRGGKVEGPLAVDHTKQAAIRLMAGHAPKPAPAPALVLSKPSPLRRTPRSRVGRTPGNTSVRSSGAGRTVTILEITDSDGRNSSLRNSTASRRSGQKSSKKSESASPRKSALKDPSAKRGARKTESIKFDLSNLENRSQDTDMLMLSDTRPSYAADSASDDDVTLRYSDSSALAPSPRRSIHSRSGRILHSTLGDAASSCTLGDAASSCTLGDAASSCTLGDTASSCTLGDAASSCTLSGAASSRTRPARSTRSSRGSLMVQRALSHTDPLSYSRRTTQSVGDTQNATVATAYRTRTLSPRTSRNDLESYSIVDLVSIDTDESALSASANGIPAGTPRDSSVRRTRSFIAPTLLGSSTPYVKGGPATPRVKGGPATPRVKGGPAKSRSRSDPSPHSASRTSNNGTQSTVGSSRSTRSKSLSTPENTEDAKKHISVNSTRISRASRSKSRLNDSELQLLDEDDNSPRTSKRISTGSKSGRLSAQTAGNDTEVTPTHSPAQDDGTCTPENTHSPEEASTPVLSIQSLLDSSQSSFASQKPTRKGRPSFNTNRKTIGGVTGPKTRVGAKSKSLSFSVRQTRLRLSNDSLKVLKNNDESKIVTPKSAVKLVPEVVKNKHSTAKKPQSKRSIIDDLNESDIVKQLFYSPVKRKLSQSMTEFSRSQLCDDDVRSHTVALSGRTPDHSLDHTESYTPEIFVSPISTPTRSPSLDGIKLMFAKTTPENDLRNVRGVKNLLRTPRTRRSIKNDLTDVSGIKNLFAKSPKNRLSDVRAKEVFASSPNNDLQRVTGVKSLFRTTNKRKSPRNELDDVRGVKKLFNTRSPANDLRNVSGVKRTLRRQSPRNDLSDVRGVKRVFRREKRNDLSDVSGVEELFNLSNYSSATASTRAESLFDQLVGKPQIRAVYSKTFSSKTVQKTKGPTAKSLHASLDQITATDNNWLEQELNKRLQIKNYLDSLKSANTFKANKSKALHASLDEVTDLDVLLEQELNKEQQIKKYLDSMRSLNESKGSQSKVNKSKANRSRFNKSKAHTSKASMSRELQKLITETVEGDAPLRTSRVRNSTVVRNESDVERKKSTCELYSAHTLPIKKRSLVEAPQKALLPLKKRVVLHSTPVKGRLHVAMDASVLARVSPIRADDTRYTEHDTSITSTQPKETSGVRSKSTRGKRVNTENFETANASEFVKPSPKNTKEKPASPVKEKAAAKAKKASPAKAKTASPVQARKASPAKARKASPVKARKASPAKTRRASPAKARKASPAKTKKASSTKPTSSPAKKLVSPVPAKTTRSRRKDVSTLESNTIKRRSTLVVSKKSPVMSPKPRATRKRKEPETSSTPKPSPKKTRATRKNTSVKDDKPKTPKNTRARAKVLKATVVVSKPSPQLKPRARRGQAAQAELEAPRNTRKTATVQDKQPESPKKSQVQRKSPSKTQAAKVQPKTRGRKTIVSESIDNAEIEKANALTKKDFKTDAPANKRTRSNRQEKSIEQAKPVRTRGKKVEPQESVESVQSTRVRRAANTDSIAPGVKTRKRKSHAAPDNEIPPKVRKSKEVAERGRKRATEVSIETKNTRKKSAVKESQGNVSESPAKVTRGRKAAGLESVKATKQTEQKTRGRKADIEIVPANQVTGKRKRIAATELSPVKERKTRATRGNTTTEAKPAGRSRRR